MKKYFCNDKGGLLVITLMVFLIFSVLGIALLTLTFSDVTLSEVDHDTQSAFYIAEAGANEAYVQIKNEIESKHEHTNSETTYFSAVNEYLTNNWNNEALNDFEDSFGEQPKAIISINPISSSPNTYELASEGQIGERARTVTKSFTVNWNKNPSFNFPEDVVGIFKNSLSLSGGGSIIGDTYITSDIPGNIELSGGASITGTAFVPESIVDSALDIPDYIDVDVASLQQEINWNQYEAIIDEFPEIFPDYYIPEDLKIEKNSHMLIDKGNLNIANDRANNFILELTENVTFKKINVESNNDLNIDTKGNEIDIVVDHLNLAGGHLRIEGNGMINMYVRDQITVGGGSTFNQNGETSQLNIFYKDNDPVTFSNNIHLNGSFFAKKADLTLTGGSSFNGYMMTGGNNVTLKDGNITVGLIFAPFAKLDVKGGANVTGVVLAENYLGAGGTSITYKHIDMEDFPFGSENNNTGEDIVDADPITEIKD